MLRGIGAALEQGSTHPLAAAIRRSGHAARDASVPAPVADFSAGDTGAWVRGTIDGETARRRVDRLSCVNTAFLVPTTLRKTLLAAGNTIVALLHGRPLHRPHRALRIGCAKTTLARDVSAA